MIRALTERFGLDRLALGLSALCLVHCVASVALVASIAGGSHLLAHPAWHQFGLGLAIIFAAFGLGSGFRRHRQSGPFVVGGAGLILMVAALFAPHGVFEAALTILGVGTVALAHVQNIRLRAVPCR